MRVELRPLRQNPMPAYVLTTTYFYIGLPYLLRWYHQGSGCSTTVEQTHHDLSVVGSNPVG